MALSGPTDKMTGHGQDETHPSELQGVRYSSTVKAPNPCQTRGVWSSMILLCLNPQTRAGRSTSGTQVQGQWAGLLYIKCSIIVYLYFAL